MPGHFTEQIDEVSIRHATHFGRACEQFQVARHLIVNLQVSQLANVTIKAAGPFRKCRRCPDFQQSLDRSITGSFQF